LAPFAFLSFILIQGAFVNIKILVLGLVISLTTVSALAIASAELSYESELVKSADYINTLRDLNATVVHTDKLDKDALTPEQLGPCRNLVSGQSSAFLAVTLSNNEGLKRFLFGTSEVDFKNCGPL
jgi:hypothetical protein